MTLQPISADQLDTHRETIIKALADRITMNGQVEAEQAVDLAREQLPQLLETRENYFFSAGDSLVWLMSQQPRRLSLMLPTRGDLSDSLLQEIEQWSAHNNIQSLRISLSNAGQAQRFEELGYTITNVIMEKQIDAAPTSRLTLVPMTPERFDEHIENLIVDYGKEKLANGNFSEDNWLEQSRAEIMQLVPQMLDTPGHFAFTLRNEDAHDVGILWIWQGTFGRDEGFWIYDIVIDEDQRRKGYGTQALLAFEVFVIDEGLNRVGLHVFGHNHAARALYEKMDYTATQIVLQKSFD